MVGKFRIDWSDYGEKAKRFQRAVADMPDLRRQIINDIVDRVYQDVLDTYMNYIAPGLKMPAMWTGEFGRKLRRYKDPRGNWGLVSIVSGSYPEDRAERLEMGSGPRSLSADEMEMLKEWVADRLGVDHNAIEQVALRIAHKINTSGQVGHQIFLTATDPRMPKGQATLAWIDQRMQELYREYLKRHGLMS